MTPTNQTLAAVLRKAGGPFSLETISVASPRADEVMVQIVAVGVCHTDIVCRDGFPVPLPIVLGHEGAGVVRAVGTEVKKVKVGDHVVLAFNSCGQCRPCTDGHPADCPLFLPHNFSGARPADGTTPLSQEGHAVHGMFFGQSSFAGLSIAREINTVVVPKDLPLESLGPLGCGIMTGAGAAIKSLKIQSGQTLAIYGAGAVGLSAMLGALVMKATKVFVVEPNAARRELALELGATAAFNPLEDKDLVVAIKARNGGMGVDHAIDTSALPQAIAQAIDCVAPGGVVALVGVPKPDASIPATLLDLLSKSVTLQPVIEGDANPQTFIPELIEHYRAGRFPFDRLIKRYPFSQINEAMDATQRGEAIKAVLMI